MEFLKPACCITEKKRRSDTKEGCELKSFSMEAKASLQKIHRDPNKKTSRDKARPFSLSQTSTLLENLTDDAIA